MVLFVKMTLYGTVNSDDKIADIGFTEDQKDILNSSNSMQDPDEVDKSKEFEELPANQSDESFKDDINSNLIENKSNGITRRRELVILFSVYFSALCSASFYSLLAPFFPYEAKKKLASDTAIGFIFGFYQIIIFIFSPILGHYMTIIGPKFMYVSGIFVASSCAILFGCLDWCPPGKIYVTMCLLVRGFEGLGIAGITTSSLTIIGNTFPHRTASLMGGLEAFHCIGYMLGPPVGGVIFQYGGFPLTFFVTGGLFMIGGILSLAFIPSIKGTNEPRKISYLSLLKVPMVLLVGFGVIVAQGAIGFMNVGLSQHLHKFTQAPVAIGGLFLVPALIMLLFAPVSGYICDKNRNYGRYLLFTGCMIGGIGTTGLGPSPLYHAFLPTDSLAVVAVSLAISGIGMSCLVVAYQEVITASLNYGYGDSVETRGLISGFYSSFNSFGAFLGPITAGLLLEYLHFDWSATFFGIGVFIGGFNILVYTIYERILKPRYLRNNDEPHESIDTIGSAIE